MPLEYAIESHPIQYAEVHRKRSFAIPAKSSANGFSATQRQIIKNNTPRMAYAQLDLLYWSILAAWAHAHLADNRGEMKRLVAASKKAAAAIKKLQASMNSEQLHQAMVTYT